MLTGTLEHVPLPTQDEEDDGGDTQIATVIDRGTAGPLHRPVMGADTQPPSNFDLESYRRDMGMLGYPTSDLEELEEEDEDLIVLTRPRAR